MRLSGRIGVLMLMVIGLVTVQPAGAAPKAPAEPANTIKDVMKKAHKDGLLKKVTDNQATDEEKKQLLDLYIDMLEGTPKKGEKGDWVMAAGRSVVAASKVVVGREGAIDELKEATNCKACHDPFK